MAKKTFTYKGKTIEEIKKLSISQFAELLPSRERRKIRKGFTEQEKILLKRLKEKSQIKTHCRDMIIMPEMIGKIIQVHSGKSFETVRVEDEMLGHRLGEFVQTTKRVVHGAAGIGATKSSSAMAVR